MVNDSQEMPPADAAAGLGHGGHGLSRQVVIFPWKSWRSQRFHGDFASEWLKQMQFWMIPLVC